MKLTQRQGGAIEGVKRAGRIIGVLVLVQLEYYRRSRQGARSLPEPDDHHGSGMGLLTVVIVALTLAQGQPQSLRAGVLAAFGERKVLALEGLPAAVGTVVTVVSVEERQQVSRATIVRELAGSDDMAKHAMSGSFYEVAAEPGSSALPAFGIVIVGRPDVRRAGSSVVLRLAAPRSDVYVRSCTSFEGVHLTLWAGTPLKSPRLWHMYYYLGYDVEPTCTPADTSATAVDRRHWPAT